jgi:hypothetical protein
MGCLGRNAQAGFELILLGAAAPRAAAIPSAEPAEWPLHLAVLRAQGAEPSMTERRANLFRNRPQAAGERHETHGMGPIIDTPEQVAEVVSALEYREVPGARIGREIAAVQCPRFTANRSHVTAGGRLPPRDGGKGAEPLGSRRRSVCDWAQYAQQRRAMLQHWASYIDK